MRWWCYVNLHFLHFSLFEIANSKSTPFSQCFCIFHSHFLLVSCSTTYKTSTSVVHLLFSWRYSLVHNSQGSPERNRVSVSLKQKLELKSAIVQLFCLENFVISLICNNNSLVNLMWIQRRRNDPDIDESK